MNKENWPFWGGIITWIIMFIFLTTGLAGAITVGKIIVAIFIGWFAGWAAFVFCSLYFSDEANNKGWEYPYLRIRFDPLG